MCVLQTAATTAKIESEGDGHRVSDFDGSQLSASAVRGLAGPG